MLESRGNASPTLDEILDDAFDQANEKAQEAEQAIPEEEVSAQPALEAEGTEESKTEEEGTPEKEPTEAVSTGILKAPETWSKERKEIFRQLPPNAKKEWLAAYKDFQKGLSDQGAKNAETKKYADSINEVLKPFESDMQKYNLSKPEAIKRLTQLYASVVTDPVGHIKWLMQTANLTPQQVFGTTQQLKPGQPGWVAPELLAVQQQSQAAMREVASMKQELLNKQTEGFVLSQYGAADENGNSKYPYLEQLDTEMAEIINNSPQLQAMEPSQKFDYAYRLALGQNHDKLMQVKLNEVQTQKKNRAASIKPGLGTPPSSSKNGMSLDDIISDAMAQAGLE